MKIARRSFFTAFAGLFLVPNLPAKPTPVEAWQQGPAWLEKWKRAARVPVREWAHGQGLSRQVVERLLSSTENQRELSFRYQGGSTPGQLRRVSPGLLFRVEGFGGLYLSGYCHERRAERIFRADLIQLV